MKVDISEPGGAYQIFVAEDNSTVHVRLLSNDAVGMDGDIPYTFYRYPANGNPGTVGSGGGDSIMSESIPATTYGYALDGRRVGKAGAANMKYLYDGENVVYELWGNRTVRFTHPVKSGGGCGSGACGAGSCDIFFTDHPISITIYDENGIATKYYYLYDGLGSVTELIDVNENVVNVYRYTPFGEALVREETVYNPHQYTGRQYDAESGLYHYRARAYSADIGRFMQQDPAGMIDGPNMYAYVGWNPINNVDPTGMWCGTNLYCWAVCTICKVILSLIAKILLTLWYKVAAFGYKAFFAAAQPVCAGLFALFNWAAGPVAYLICQTAVAIAIIVGISILVSPSCKKLVKQPC